MNISDTGLHLIEQFEGFRADQYRDAVGVPTIGYGTTASVIRPLPQTCTEAEAEDWLRLYVDRDCIPAIEALDVPLDQNQIDALCSFVYNLGPGVLSPVSTMGHLLRERNFTAASQAFLLYDHAGGVVLEGLLHRREAERALFDTREPAKPDAEPEHPETPADKPDTDSLPEQACDELKAIIAELKNGIVN